MNKHAPASARTTIEIEAFFDEETDEIFEVEAEWSFTAFDPGVSYGPPEACYPPEGGELLGVELTLPDGKRIANGENWLRQHLGNEAFEVQVELAAIEAEPTGPDPDDYYDRGEDRN